MSTNIADAIVPENFARYLVVQNEKNTNLMASGTMVTHSEAVGAGFTQNLPFWGSLQGVLEDNQQGDGTGPDIVDGLTFNETQIGNQIAVILDVGTGWQQNGILERVIGEPDALLNDLAPTVSDYWDRRIDDLGLNILWNATVGMDTPAHQTHIVPPLEVAEAQVQEGVSHDLIIVGKALAGERQEDLAAIWMHSDAFTELKRQNMVSAIGSTTVAGSGVAWASDSPPKGTIDDMLVFINDHLRPYTVLDDEGQDVALYPFLMTMAAAMAFGDGSTPRKTLETDRDIKTDQEMLTTRRRLILHPYGGQYNQATPTVVSQAQALDPANWDSAFNPGETDLPPNSGDGLGSDGGSPPAPIPGGDPISIYPLRSVVLIASLEAYDLPVTP